MQRSRPLSIPSASVVYFINISEYFHSKGFAVSWPIQLQDEVITPKENIENPHAPDDSEEEEEKLPAPKLSDFEEKLLTAPDVNRCFWPISGGHLECFLLAAKRGYVEVVKSFIRKGADVNMVSETPKFQGEDAVFLARSNLKMVKAIVETAHELNEKVYLNRVYPYVQDTLLLGLILEKNLATFKYLLENGANPNFKSSSKAKSPLIYACEENLLDFVKALVEKGADVNEKSFDGNFYWEWKKASVNVYTTPLDTAKDLSIRKFLLEKGAHVNARNGKGLRTALHRAVLNGSLDTAKLLIEKGAKVNKKDGEDNLPIHLAAKKGDYDMVKLLIQNGSNLNARDSNGDRPASSTESKAVKQLLKDNGGKTNWGVFS